VGSIARVVAPYRGLPRGIYALSIARAVNSLGSFVFPFSTILFTAKLGMSNERAGLFLLVASVGEIAGMLLGGRLADWFPRKAVYVLFASASAALLLPCALGQSAMIPWLLVASRACGGAAEPANAAMVVDLTTPKTRPSAYALVYLGINVGFAIGPTIGGLLYAEHLALVFIGDAITTLAAMLIVIVMVRGTRPEQASASVPPLDPARVDEQPDTAGIFSALAKRPRLVAFAVVSIAYSFVYGQHVFALPIQVDTIFGERGPAVYGMLMSANAVAVLALTAPATAFARRATPLSSIAVAGLFYAVGFGMIGAIVWLPAFVVSTALWTVGEILQSTQQGVYLANHTPASHRGRFNAILPLVMRSGYAFGPWVAGRYIDALGVRALWPVLFAVAVAGALGMTILARADRAHAEVMR